MQVPPAALHAAAAYPGVPGALVTKPGATTGAPADATEAATGVAGNLTPLQQAKAALKPNFRPNLPSLRQRFVDFLWHAVYTYGAFWLYIFRLPFLLALRFSPPGIRQIVYQFESLIHHITLPVINLNENITYMLFKKLDQLASHFMMLPSQTTKHFQLALVASLHFIQQRAEVLEKHGMQGVPTLLGFAGKAA